MSTITLTLRDLEIAALVALLVFAAWGAGRLRWRRSLPRFVTRLALSPRRAITIAGFTGFAVSAAVSLSYPVEPRFHDEFSYLLGADTFASGRLSNPTHPHWEHLESFHVIQQPSRQSKYPPGQASLLALGQLLTGRPLVGVWLGMGLACAGLCWMLVSFVPARWALVGALLPLLRFGIFETTPLFAYWQRSYWGGALPMLGGALVYGGMRRIVREPRAGDALCFAAGGGLLLLTRPFEGALASLPAIAVVGVWLCRQRGAALALALRRVLLPSLATFLLVIAALGIYNQRVTGDPLLFPYQVYEERYSGGLTGFFRADAAPGPAESGDSARNPHMREAYETLQQTRREHMDEPGEVASLSFERIVGLAMFFLGPLLLLPLILNAGALLRDRWMLLALAGCALVGLEVAVLDYVMPHYLAPVACLIVLLVIQSLRCWQGFRLRGRRVGAVAVRGTLVLACVSFACAVTLFAFRAHSAGEPWNLLRAQMVQSLESQTGRHLVLVVYDEQERDVSVEWVYNRADIDGSKIVWARSLGGERDARLRTYFADRVAWMAWVDERPIKLKRLAR